MVHITDSDEYKTAFRTCYRSFKWFIISFSLTNVLIVFQQFMNDIFSDLWDICVMIYLNDICYDSMLKVLSKELTLVLSDTRELDRVPNTK